MFKIRDGIIVTSEANHMDDMGLVVVVDTDDHDEVWFVCRQDQIKRNWQISSRISSRDVLYFVDGKKSTPDDLFACLEQDWPEDLMWLLFHPEIYDGRYDGS